MLRVVIADDEETIRNGMVRLIKSFHLDLQIVATAENGKQALKAMEDYNPEIIIMDISMPYMTGLDAIEQIRMKNKKSKIIIISGYGQFEYAQRALALGVFNYLLKPVDYRDFKDILKKAINSYMEENFNLGANEILSEDLGVSVVEYIKNNFNKNLNIQDLSGKFHTSQSNLTKIIKQKTGQNFTDYLNNIRISTAKKLLVDKDKNYTISEITDIVGYNSLHYFSRIFKNYTGTSPLNFKKEYKTNNKL